MSSVTALAPRTTTRVARACGVPPVGTHPNLKAQRAGDRLAVRRRATAIAVRAVHHEVAVGRSLDGRALRRLHPCLERNLAGSAGSEPNDDHLIRRAREDLAREGDAAPRVRHVRRGGCQIEIAPVVLHTTHGGNVSIRSPTVWYGHLGQRLGHHFLARQSRGRRIRPRQRRLTSGRASLASGLTGSYGPPAQSVSSLSCSRSFTTPPNTMAPRRPFPTGSARTHSALAACAVGRAAVSGRYRPPAGDTRDSVPTPVEPPGRRTESERVVRDEAGRFATTQHSTQQRSSPSSSAAATLLPTRHPLPPEAPPLARRRPRTRARR